MKYVLSIATIFLAFISPFLNAETFEKKQLIEESVHYPFIILPEKELNDLELLLDGTFSPLEGFMNQNDYENVLNHCRLSNGVLWPVPITLAIEPSTLENYQSAKYITLRDPQNTPLAILEVDDIYKPDLLDECKKLLGTTEKKHPYVKTLTQRKSCYYIGGKLRKIQTPRHFDFQDERLSPDEIKNYFQKNSWDNVLGLSTKDPLHKPHINLFLDSSRQTNTKLFLQTIVGNNEEVDIDYPTKVRCIQKLLAHFPKGSIKLSLLPLFSRQAGPREALLHAIIKKNYGCTHFLVSEHHASPKTNNSQGLPFYEKKEAQKFVESYEQELGLEVLPETRRVFSKDLGSYIPVDHLSDGSSYEDLDNEGLKEALLNNSTIPSWFTFPEIVEELKSSYEKHEGICIYFTGLSGSGKSTLSNALRSKLQSLDPLKRDITVLDGDIIRENLSKGLGFSKQDRSINVQRIGFVASLIVKNGGICLCANIAPYENDRIINKNLISQYGPYIEVFVDTPIEVCESRDAKGLYKLAREGVIKEFTGISDPFEKPSNGVIRIDGSKPIEELLDQLLEVIREKTLLD